jgi:hypothetical protein
LLLGFSSYEYGPRIGKAENVNAAEPSDVAIPKGKEVKKERGE